MISKTTYKTPEGKNINITVDISANKLQNIEITGDFSLYPDKSIEEIERGIMDVDIDEAKITQKLQSIIKKHKITFVGITEYSFARAVIISCRITK